MTSSTDAALLSSTSRRTSLISAVTWPLSDLWMTLRDPPTSCALLIARPATSACSGNKYQRVSNTALKYLHINYMTYVLPSVGCAPLYAHLALRPRVWAHCTSTGQEVSGVVLQPSHICIHTYTYVLTARAVYVVRYPTLLQWSSRSQADHSIERDKGV